MPSWPSEMEILKIALENCQKSARRFFTVTPIFSWFREFVYNVLSKVVYVEKSATFTGKNLVCVEIYFFISFQATSLTLSQKNKKKIKKSSTAVFLILLRKLYEQLFYGTIPGDGLPLTVHFDEVFSFPQGALKSNVISTWILRLCFFRDSILMLQHVF